VTSRDDPIIPVADLERLARTPRLTIATTSFGGHCGFMARLGGTSWIDATAAHLILA